MAQNSQNKVDGMAAVKNNAGNPAYEDNYDKLFGWKCTICYQVGNRESKCSKCGENK